MTTDATPAGWYADPTEVGELRYYDGDKWTEHVTIDGVQTTAPYETSPERDAGRPTFTMTRVAQWRGDAEQPIDVVGRNGVMGRFVTTLDGAPGYRFDAVDGEAIVGIVKPGLKGQVDVLSPRGDVIATITKIGRLHSRYDVALSNDPAKATMKLSGAGGDSWDFQVRGGTAATISRTVSSAADPLNFAAVTYAATLAESIDDQLQRVLLVLPLTIDVLDTQTL